MPPESSGKGEVTVVDPGSADDPFTAAKAGEGEAKGPDATGADATTSQPDAKPPEDKPADEGGGPGSTEAILQELKGHIDSEVDGRVTAAQKGWDKRNRTLENQVKEQGKQLATAKREAEAANLSEEERAAFQQKWDLEDQLTALRTKTDAVDDYRKAVVAHEMMVRFGEFGLTQEDLEACDTPEEMQVLGLQTKADFLERGGKPAGKKAPAGAAAKSDVGGGPAGPEEFKLSTEQNLNAMSKNVGDLFKQPGNVR